MRKKKYVGAAIIAAFLTLATTVFVQPVFAAEDIEPKELDGEKILLAFKDLDSKLSADKNSKAYMDVLKSDEDVKRLIEQIINAKDDAEGERLVDRLYEIASSKNEFDSIKSVLESKAYTSDISDLNDMVLPIIQSSSSCVADSVANSQQSSLSSANTGPNTLKMVVYAGNMVKYEPDSDGDGYSDSDEVEMGTNPNDPNSTPVIGDDPPDNIIGHFIWFTIKFVTGYIKSRITAGLLLGSMFLINLIFNAIIP